MKRIAIFIPTLRSGGAEKQAVILASMLAKEYETHVLVSSGDGVDAYFADILSKAKVSLHFVTGNLFRQVKDLRGIFHRNHIDVLFNYLTYPDVIGGCVAKLVGIPLIYNGIRNSSLPWMKLFSEKIAHNYFASATIFNCYSGRENFKRHGFSNEKSIVIPNCYPDIASVVVRPERKMKKIITVGRFVPQKDYLTAIKSIAVLLGKRKDFRFQIVGYGKQESLIRNWLFEYGVEEQTDVFINPSNISELLRDADVYLSTSLFEGTSNSIMEALNYSLPVVCTNVGDNSCLVHDGENGFLSPIGDFELISELLDDLLESYDKRNVFGEKGNALLKENFSAPVFYQRYVSLIEK